MQCGHGAEASLRHRNAPARAPRPTRGAGRARELLELSNLILLMFRTHLWELRMVLCRLYLGQLSHQRVSEWELV